MLRARALQEIDYPNGEWRNKKGARSLELYVTGYLKATPHLSVTEVAKRLGVSRTTVYKYKKSLED